MSSEHLKNRAVAFRGLRQLLILTVLVALTLFATNGLLAACSAILGGLSFLIPNACFVRFAFRVSGEESAENALRWFYLGEALKLVSTAIFISICLLAFKQLNMLIFFTVFIVVMMLNTALMVKNITF